LLGKLLDDADALAPQRIAQHAHDLEALGDAPLRIPELALLDAHAGETGEGPLVGRRPAERLAQPVGLLLIVALDRPHGRAGATDHRVDFGALGLAEL